MPASSIRPKADSEDSEGITFGKLPPETRFTLVLPPNLKEAGTNTALTVKRTYTMRTGAYPPLVKFPRSFGILGGRPIQRCRSRCAISSLVRRGRHRRHRSQVATDRRAGHDSLVRANTRLPAERPLDG